MAINQKCRGCGCLLSTERYGVFKATEPVATREPCIMSFWGGHSCDAECERRASEKMHRSIDRHMTTQGGEGC